MSHVLSIVLVLVASCKFPESPRSASQAIREPDAGTYPAEVVIFSDSIGAGISSDPFGSAVISVDTELTKRGTAAWRWDVNAADGVNVLWGSWTSDTTVFWANELSRVGFWIRPSNDKVMFHLSVGFKGGQYEISPPTVIGSAGEWRYMEFPFPKQAIGVPLNLLVVGTWHNGGGASTIHVDDFKITNVRLYAGIGEGEPFEGVVANQIGYDPFGIKTFSSEKYQSFQLVRVRDNKPVYKSTDVRTVKSKVMSNAPVYIGDFTKFQEPGRYVIRLDNGKESYPFDIGANVYDEPLRAAIRFFYYQRNNTEIEMPYAEGPWVHERDGFEEVLLPDGDGTKIVRHGWHDAGDFAVYMPNHAYACFYLALTWDDFRYASDDLNIPESGDGVPDLLNELRWGLDWIVDMQDQSDGGFYHNMCVRGGNKYRYGSTTALSIPGYQLTNKTTSATAAAVGVLAYAAHLFEQAGVDPPFASTMRQAALSGWRYLESHPRQIDIHAGCKEYQDADDIHARFFAAAALFLATGEEKYHQYVLANDPGSQWISDYNNQTNLAYLLYLRSKKTDPAKKLRIESMLAERAREANADRIGHPFGFVGYYYWGSLGTAFARVSNYCMVDWRVNGNESSMFTLLQQLHYTFGQNSLGFVYFSGFGVNRMQHAYHNWLKVLNASPFAFPGMLAGGPNENPDKSDTDFPFRNVYGYSKPAGTPIDSRYSDTDSWSTNEVAVNQSAQLVYVLAAAQNFAKNKTNRQMIGIGVQKLPGTPMRLR